MLFTWSTMYTLRSTHHIILFGCTYTVTIGPLPQLETWRWPQLLPTLCGCKAAQGKRPRPEHYHPQEHAREVPHHTLEPKPPHLTEAKITASHRVKQPNSSAWTPQITYQRSAKTPTNQCKRLKMRQRREATLDLHQLATYGNRLNTTIPPSSETLQAR